MIVIKDLHICNLFNSTLMNTCNEIHDLASCSNFVSILKCLKVAKISFEINLILSMWKIFIKMLGQVTYNIL